MSNAIYVKLLTIQKSVDELTKDSEGKDYKYVSDEKVLDTIRPLMNKLNLLMLPTVASRGVHTDETKSGTTRYLTEVDITWTWVDVDTGETLAQPFYAQGVDLAGEKGVGKAITYGEKYYLLKAFHIPTPKDDPDGDATTKSGEKKQRGTQAAKETADFQRKSVEQMAAVIGVAANMGSPSVIQAFTKNDKTGYAGVTSGADISAAALPIVYQKMKGDYAKRFGKEFIFTEVDG